MESKQSVRMAVVILVVGVVIVGLSVSWGQDRKTHHVETRVYATPEYQSDTTRAINAYERVMERYMEVTEGNFTAITADMQTIAVKLEAIDARLASLDTRLERIERHLGVAPPPAPDPNAIRLLGPAPTGADALTGR